jgi:hypothetical protein
VADDVGTDREYDVLAKQGVHTDPVQRRPNAEAGRCAFRAIVISLWSPRLPCSIRQPTAPRTPHVAKDGSASAEPGRGDAELGYLPMRTNLASHLPADGQQETLPIASKCSTSKMTPPAMAGTSCRCSRRIRNRSPEDLRPAKSDRPGSMCRSVRRVGNHKRLLPAICQHLRTTGLSDLGEPLCRQLRD